MNKEREMGEYSIELIFAFVDGLLKIADRTHEELLKNDEETTKGLRRLWGKCTICGEKPAINKDIELCDTCFSKEQKEAFKEV